MDFRAVYRAATLRTETGAGRLWRNAREAPARGTTAARRPDRRARGHFRITFSDGVSASMNAGRLKSRSAYFISGAADFGRLML